MIHHARYNPNDANYIAVANPQTMMQLIQLTRTYDAALSVLAAELGGKFLEETEQKMPDNALHTVYAYWRHRALREAEISLHTKKAG